MFNNINLLFKIFIIYNTNESFSVKLISYVIFKFLVILITSSITSTLNELPDLSLDQYLFDTYIDHDLLLVHFLCVSSTLNHRYEKPIL